MHIVMFYHSLLSDWNHGNAHFLRGIATELVLRGHDVKIYEPEDSWSLSNLISSHGTYPLEKFKAVYPRISSTRYDLKSLDLEKVLTGADLVIVHEWNDLELIRKIGDLRSRSNDFRVLFHDTHHRSISDPETIASYHIEKFDGVLAFGNVIRDIYLKKGWTNLAWTWHEAADTRVFYPRRNTRTNHLVWIGNWGDQERTAELQEFLIKPADELNLLAEIYGVRYPAEARAALKKAGIRYKGWLANFEAPDVFSRFKVTVHVPRRPYVKSLPGIPTIRPFEAMACGIPLISAPWNDREHLFKAGKDFLYARNGKEMKKLLRDVINDKQLARGLAEHALKTIKDKHTCTHRVDQLLQICEELSIKKEGVLHE